MHLMKSNDAAGNFNMLPARRTKPQRWSTSGKEFMPAEIIDVPAGVARRRRASRSAPCLLLLMSLCAVGCSDSAKVSGLVSLDDKPFVGGRDMRVTVMFVPESGDGATAAGLVDDNGKYNLSTGSKSGLKPGNYLVAISAVEMIRSKDDSAPPGGRRLTSRRYADPRQSGFRAEVQSGSNTFDFNLRSDAAERS